MTHKGTGGGLPPAGEDKRSPQEHLNLVTSFLDAQLAQIRETDFCWLSWPGCDVLLQFLEEPNISFLFSFPIHTHHSLCKSELSCQLGGKSSWTPL